MLCRQLDGQLLIRSADATQQYSLDSSSFAFVSAIRLDPTETHLAFTAVPQGKRLPSLSVNSRGDLALFVCDLRENRWSEIHDGYEHDPAWFPDRSRLAFHTGNDIASISMAGAEFQEHFRSGRFNWGPPSVCVSPDGSRIGLIKWKGDDRHIGVCNLQTGEAEIHPVRSSSYSWLDEETILYSLGSGLKALDVSSGRTTQLLRDIHALRRLCPLTEVSPGLESFLQSSSALIVQEVRQPNCYRGSVYFLAYAASSNTRCWMVGSMRADRSEVHEHFILVDPRAYVREFHLVNEGRTLAVHLEYQNRRSVRVERQEILYTGERAELIPPGYAPLPTIPDLEFGFHYPGQCDADGIRFGTRVWNAITGAFRRR